MKISASRRRYLAWKEAAAGAVQPVHARANPPASRLFTPVVIKDPFERLIERTIQRFRSRLVKRKSGCWEHQGTKHEDGYALVRVAGKTMGAHRAAWIFWRGYIPKGMSVCHSCDNPPCCNPDHLWLGTQKDNMADAARKGRLKRTTQIH